MSYATKLLIFNNISIIRTLKKLTFFILSTALNHRSYIRLHPDNQEEGEVPDGILCMERYIPVPTFGNSRDGIDFFSRTAATTWGDSDSPAIIFFDVNGYFLNVLKTERSWKEKSPFSSHKDKYLLKRLSVVRRSGRNLRLHYLWNRHNSYWLYPFRQIC